MTVTIVGTGKMAKGIAARLLAGGHTVELHARDTSKGEALKKELDSSNITIHSIGSDLQDVVIPAVHYGAEFEAVVGAYGDALNGKIVIDITNPVDFNTFQLIPEAGKSGAEAIAALIPNTHVVKAFNTLFASVLPSGTVGGEPLDVFIAGDDQKSKEVVAELINTSGMRAIDTGPLSNARHLEGIELIHMITQDHIKGNWMSAIKFLNS